MSTRTPGPSTLFPSGQARQNYQRNWGNYASVATLPNGAGNALAAPYFAVLEVGDVAHVTGVGPQYCTSVGTAGGSDAVWASSAGDVVGPASSTDKAVVRWNGVTGKLIQNSVAILTDAGEFQAGLGSQATPSYSWPGGAGLTDKGFYSDGANAASFSAAGSRRLQFYASGIQFFGGGGINASTANTGIFVQGNTGGVATPSVLLNNAAAFTAGAGVAQQGIALQHGINQTSTASFVSLTIDQGLIGAGTGVPVFGSGGGFFLNFRSNSVAAFQVTNAGAVLAGPGSASLPSLAFLAETTLGFYRSGAGSLGFASAGAIRMTFSSTGLGLVSGSGIVYSTTTDIGITLRGLIATVATPSVTHDNGANVFTGSAASQIGTRFVYGVNQTATATFSALTMDLGLVVAGTGVPVFGSGGGFFADWRANSVSLFQVNSAGQVRVATGAGATAPSYSFVSFTTTGFYATSSTNVNLSLNSNATYSFNASALNFLQGNVGIYASALNTAYFLGGNWTTAADGPFYVKNLNAFTASTAVNQKGFRIYAGVNQTSTASFTGIYLNLSLNLDGVTGSPVFGSGGGLLVDLQVGLVSQFQVTSGGVSISKGENPQTTATYDLGTNALLWRDLYLSGNVRGGFPVSDWAFSGLYTGGAGLVTSYASDAGVAAAVSATSVGYPQPRAVTFKNLKVNPSINTLPATATFTVYKNGVATSITCTVGAGSTAIAGDTTNTAAFAVDDRFDLVVTETGIGTLAFSATVECYVA